MAAHDTDPQHSRPDAESHRSADTGGDRSEEAASPSVALAVSLLENVGDTALPMQGVAETHGHVAAAFAASAHRPAKGREAREPEADVQVNQTAPLPIVRPPAPRLRDATDVMSRAPSTTTVPRARPAPASVATPNRARVAIAGLGALGMLVAAAIVWMEWPRTAGTEGDRAAASTEPAAVTSTMPAPSSTAAARPKNGPIEAASVAPPPSASASGLRPTPPAVARSAASGKAPSPPAVAPSTHRAPRPAGTFDEPERTID